MVQATVYQDPATGVTGIIYIDPETGIEQVRTTSGGSPRAGAIREDIAAGRLTVVDTVEVGGRDVSTLLQGGTSATRKVVQVTGAPFMEVQRELITPEGVRRPATAQEVTAIRTARFRPIVGEVMPAPPPVSRLPPAFTPISAEDLSFTPAPREDIERSLKARREVIEAGAIDVSVTPSISARGLTEAGFIQPTKALPQEVREFFVGGPPTEFKGGVTPSQIPQAAREALGGAIAGIILSPISLIETGVSLVSRPVETVSAIPSGIAESFKTPAGIGELVGPALLFGAAGRVRAGLAKPIGAPKILEETVEFGQARLRPLPPEGKIAAFRTEFQVTREFLPPPTRGQILGTKLGIGKEPKPQFQLTTGEIRAQFAPVTPTRGAIRGQALIDVAGREPRVVPIKGIRDITLEKPLEVGVSGKQFAFTEASELAGGKKAAVAAGRGRVVEFGRIEEQALTRRFVGFEEEAGVLALGRRVRQTRLGSVEVLEFKEPFTEIIPTGVPKKRIRLEPAKLPARTEEEAIFRGFASFTEKTRPEALVREVPDTGTVLARTKTTFLPVPTRQPIISSLGALGGGLARQIPIRGAKAPKRLPKGIRRRGLEVAETFGQPTLPTELKGGVIGGLSIFRPRVDTRRIGKRGAITPAFRQDFREETLVTPATLPKQTVDLFPKQGLEILPRTLPRTRGITAGRTITGTVTEQLPKSVQEQITAMPPARGIPIIPIIPVPQPPPRRPPIFISRPRAGARRQPRVSYQQIFKSPTQYKPSLFGLEIGATIRGRQPRFVGGGGAVGIRPIILAPRGGGKARPAKRQIPRSQLPRPFQTGTAMGFIKETAVYLGGKGKPSIPQFSLRKPPSGRGGKSRRGGTFGGFL